MIHMVGFGEFQDRRRRIDGLKDMRGQPALIELQRRRPVLERDKPIDVLVVAFFVERLIEGNAAELQHAQASKPRRGQRSQDSFGGDPQRVVKRG
jgi:hypothetical protein